MTAPNEADLALIGYALLNMAASPILMRHASPAGMVGYAEAATTHQQIVLDYTEWVADGCLGPASERLENFLRESGWLQQTIEQAAAS